MYVKFSSKDFNHDIYPPYFTNTYSSLGIYVFQLSIIRKLHFLVGDLLMVLGEVLFEFGMIQISKLSIYTIKSISLIFC